MSSSNPTSEPTTTTTSPSAFKKFDEYPWLKDRQFLQALLATLGPSLLTTPLPPTSTTAALSTTLQARIWWYKTRLNIDIDRTAYESTISTTRPDAAILARAQEIHARLTNSSSSQPSEPATSSVPSWQLQAPKVDPTKKADDGISRTGTAGGDAAPYPESFQAIIEAVTSGKPVPGIREIPNTVVRQAGITPVGKLPPPRKPWERNVSTTPAQVAAENVLDTEFPPVEETAAQQEGTAVQV